jgi:OPA family glycerol-3-phosphate transporter-like MFS transporter
VLPNRFLWAIAIANAFCYFVRYGVVNWIPTYLETAKGFSFHQSSTAWAIYEYAAIPGTIACGWLSDRWFRGRRAPMTMIFMALTLCAVVVYWLNLRGPLWIDYAALFCGEQPGAKNGSTNFQRSKQYSFGNVLVFMSIRSYIVV